MGCQFFPFSKMKTLQGRRKSGMDEMWRRQKKKKQSRKVRSFPDSGGCGGKAWGVMGVESRRDFGAL